MAPLVRRGWALRGKTPILLQRTRLTEKVSAIAALGLSPVRKRTRVCVSLLANQNMTTARFIRFLKSLRRHIRGPIIFIWDRLPVHRAKKVQKYLASVPGLHVEYLPPYSPHLNPVEMLWSYLKYHRLANFAPFSVRHLARVTRRHIRSFRGSQTLLRSFIRGTPLSSCLD